jgi:hypothetical protein
VIVRMAGDGAVLDAVRIENDALALAGELAKADLSPWWLCSMTNLGARTVKNLATKVSRCTLEATSYNLGL